MSTLGRSYRPAGKLLMRRIPLRVKHFGDRSGTSEPFELAQLRLVPTSEVLQAFSAPRRAHRHFTQYPALIGLWAICAPIAVESLCCRKSDPGREPWRTKEA